jgi:GNAT superfamily N-acetyltransferase
MAQLTHVLRTTGEDPVARELLAGIYLPSYVVLLEDERPVAGGGLRPLGDGIGEVKRMFIVPDRRGAGLARRLPEQLEAPARDAGNAHATFRGEKPL